MLRDLRAGGSARFWLPSVGYGSCRRRSIGSPVIRLNRGSRGCPLACWLLGLRFVRSDRPPRWIWPS